MSIITQDTIPEINQRLDKIEARLDDFNARLKRIEEHLKLGKTPDGA